MAAMLTEAARHEGTAFLEILQNCIVFNDGAWHQYTEKGMKEQNVLYLEDGKPLLFGPDNDRKGIRIDDFRAEIVPAGSPGIAVHREDDTHGGYAFLLSRLDAEGGPMPVGVLRRMERPSFERLVVDQVAAAQAKGEGDIDQLLRSGDIWEHK